LLLRLAYYALGIIESIVLDVTADAIEHEQLGLVFPIKVALT